LDAEEIGDLRDVVIQHDSLTVWADHGSYNRTTSVATFWGNVRFNERGQVVLCRRAVYDRSSETGILTGEVLAADTSFSASSDSAFIDRNNDSVTLFSNAAVHDSAGVIRAQRIDYDRRSGIAVAQVNVFASDMETGSVVRGERLVYNSERDEAVVTGDPVLTTPGEEEDTLVVAAEELRLHRGEAWAEGLRDVRIRQGAVNASGDHALLDENAGWLRLTGNPAAWDPDGRITADTLVVIFENRVVRRLDAIGNVYVVQAPSTGEKVGEKIIATGERTVAHFHDGVVESLVVEGSAVSDYYPAPADLETGTGVNHCRARRITLFLEGGRATNVLLEGEATGRYWFASEGGPEKDDAAGADTTATDKAATAGSDTTGIGTTGAESDSLLAADSLAESPADSVQVLTVSSVLEEIPEEEAPIDSAAADSLMWVERMRTLENVDPPDSLFPGGMDDVTYGGDIVEFHVETDEIRLRENTTVRYQDADLSADEIVLRASDESIEATGSPMLSDPGGDITGHTMTYDINTKKGLVYSGRTEFEGGYYYGRRIKKVTEQNLLVDHGVYTTCDQTDPHFHFLTPQLKLRLKDKVIGRPVIFHIGHIPIMAAPFFVFPTKKGRRSGFLMPEVEVGISQTRGRFVRNLGYYWALSDYMDVSSWVDFYENSPRWIGYFSGRYRARYLLNGSIYSSYALELPERTDSPDDATRESRRWEFRARHSQELSPTATLKVDANFVSDQDFLFEQEFGTTVEEQLDRYLRSNLSFTKSWTGASLTAAMSRNQDLEAEPGEVEVRSSLPSVGFSLNRRTLGRRSQGRDPGFLPWLASVSYGYSNRIEQSLTEIKNGAPTRASAMRHDISISDSRKLFGALNISPSFSYREFLFEKDNRNEFWQRAGSWSAALSANTTLYGTWLGGLGPLVGFRHIMVPSLSFNYRPTIRSGTYLDDEGNTQQRFSSVGGISFGNSTRSRRLALSIQNRFQAKLQRGEEVQKINELASVGISTSYDLEKEEEPLSPIRTTLRMRPHRAFNVDLSASYDVYDTVSHITSVSVNSNLSLSGTTVGALPAGAEFTMPGGDRGGRSGLVSEDERAAAGQPWRLSLGHSYTRGRDPKNYSSSLRGQLSITLTPSWQVSYSSSVNLKEKDVVSHNFSIYRDLHCWEARFERRYFGDNASFYFKINVKDIDEIFYERRSGY